MIFISFLQQMRDLEMMLNRVSSDWMAEPSESRLGLLTSESRSGPCPYNTIFITEPTWQSTFEDKNTKYSNEFPAQLLLLERKTLH